MSIDRKDRDEHQARLDWMIDEFRKAQARRRVRANARTKAVESQVKADRKATVPGSATSQ
jgi:hypothetical protein